MIITDINAVYPKYRHVVPSWRTHFWQIVVRVETDAGVTGLGYGGGGSSAVEVVNRHFRELMEGRRLDRVEDIRSIWDDLYDASLPYGRKGIAVMALSGVDLALWDLLGRAEGKPVSDLLGGKTKDLIPAYATGDDPEWYRDLGYTAHKFSHRWTGSPTGYDLGCGARGPCQGHFWARGPADDRYLYVLGRRCDVGDVAAAFRV